MQCVLIVSMFAYNVHHDIVYFLSLHRSLLTMEPVTKKMRESGNVDYKLYTMSDADKDWDQWGLRFNN